MKLFILALSLITLIAQANPFHEGVTYKPLTTAERDELRQYAEASKYLLEDALEQAQGMTFEEAMDIYRRVLAQVVTNSYNDNRRSELMMRMALNQALELTLGLPGAAAGTPESVGALSSIANTNLLVVILEDSIKLALKYIPEDQKALESGSFAELPYLRFSLERLIGARLWGAAITETAWQYRYLKIVFRQWAAVATHEGHPHRDAIAKELLHVDDLIKMQTPRTEEALKGKLRVLRGDLRRMIASLSEVLKLSENQLTEMGLEDLKFDPNLASSSNAASETDSAEEPQAASSTVDLEGQGGLFASPTGAGEFGAAAHGRLEKFINSREAGKFNPSIEVSGTVVKPSNDSSSAGTMSYDASLNLLQYAGNVSKNGTQLRFAFFNPTYTSENSSLWGDFAGGGAQFLRFSLATPGRRSPGLNFFADVVAGGLYKGSGTYVRANGQSQDIKARFTALDAKAGLEACGSSGICIEDTLGFKYNITGSEVAADPSAGDGFSTLLFSNDVATDLFSTEHSTRFRLKGHYKYEYERNIDSDSARGIHRHLFMLGGSL